VLCTAINFSISAEVLAGTVHTAGWNIVIVVLSQFWRVFADLFISEHRKIQVEIEVVKTYHLLTQR